ncbi:MAG: OmpA family protein [Bryobacteraceae bacterium]|nr:OmpA family protein [Bryobacteraceae bacterium]
MFRTNRLPRAGMSALALVMVGWLVAEPAAAQLNITTYQTAQRDDWEEINFEYNQSVLTDGFPSLLRLAELLKENPGYKVKLEGHGDQIGPDNYNDALGQRRADSVKAFLVKYGTKSSQLEAISRGKRSPKVPDTSPLARFMNRRVTMTVTDGDGKQVSAGGVGDAIKAIMDQLKMMQAKSEQCCTDILSRLNKLDDILKALRDLNQMNGDLRRELDGLKNGQSNLGKTLDEQGKQLAALGKMTGPAGPAGPAGPGGAMGATNSQQLAQGGPGSGPGAGSSTGSGAGGRGNGNNGMSGSGSSGSGSGSGSANASAKAGRDGSSSGGMNSTSFGNGRFSLLGANVGMDDSRKLTFTGRGRYFQTFAKNFAVQAQGEYMYFRDRQEGQFDIGLVNRFRSNWQAGVFTSFRTVNLRAYDRNGTLGQASITTDYLFKRGRLGAFGTKAFLDEAIINSRQISANIRLDTYLKAVDQVGVAGAIQLFKENYVEGNFGYLHGRGVASRPGGTLRFVFPLNDMVALTLEGGMNETLLSRGQNGRVVGGVLFGNQLRPKQFLAHEGPVPVDIPRVRYETLTRTIRTGFATPVADAGPDQIGVAAGSILLDGSASFHPDGDPITFQWTQVAGPAVSLAGVNTARATFTGEEGQLYAFRLTVRDPRGAQALARVTVTTRAAAPLRILRFTANPSSVRSGQSSTLTWQVDNATSVEISTIGRVDARGGSVTVAPGDTTVYRLTARGANNQELNETVTITVEKPLGRIITFTSSPMNISLGQSSTLSWQTEGAETVELSGTGPVAANGSQSVSPTQTTTYTLIVRTRFGEVTANTTIQVTPPSAPRILRFTAAPQNIVTGEAATLLWSVENATDVTISTIGSVGNNGTFNVTPAGTTVYRLTARNQSGEPVTAETTVTVSRPPAIISFTANPDTTRPGGEVTLTWITENTNNVSISGVGTVAGSGSVVVKPNTTTAYTLTASGARTTLTQQLIVTVIVPPAQGGRPPVANAGANIVTTRQEILLDGSASAHPDNKQFRYSWRAIGARTPLEIRGADTATPTVRFNQLSYGEYQFELTCTDGDGRFSTSTVKVFYGAF